MKTAGKGSHGRRSTRRTCLASGGCINAKDRHRCSDFFYLRSSRGVSQGRHHSPESSSSLWTTCRPFHPLKLLLTTCCPCSLKKIFSNPTRGDVSKRTQSSMLERYLCTLVLCFLIHQSQEVEATHLCVDGGVDKPNVLCS